LTGLTAIPVIISTTITDNGSGLDFATLKGKLNSYEFFNGAAPPLVLPEFPEKIELIIGGVPQRYFPQLVGNNIVTDSAFSQIEFKYHPHAKRLVTGNNTLFINKVKDKIGNEQNAETVQPFSFP